MPAALPLRLTLGLNLSSLPEHVGAGLRCDVAALLPLGLDFNAPRGAVNLTHVSVSSIGLRTGGVSLPGDGSSVGNATRAANAANSSACRSSLAAPGNNSCPLPCGSCWAVSGVYCGNSFGGSFPGPAPLPDGTCPLLPSGLCAAVYTGSSSAAANSTGSCASVSSSSGCTWGKWSSASFTSATALNGTDVLQLTLDVMLHPPVGQPSTNLSSILAAVHSNLRAALAAGSAGFPSFEAALDAARAAGMPLERASGVAQLTLLNVSRASAPLVQVSPSPAAAIPAAPAPASGLSSGYAALIVILVLLAVIACCMVGLKFAHTARRTAQAANKPRRGSIVDYADLKSGQFIKQGGLAPASKNPLSSGGAAPASSSSRSLLPALPSLAWASSRSPLSSGSAQVVVASPLAVVTGSSGRWQQQQQQQQQQQAASSSQISLQLSPMQSSR